MISNNSKYFLNFDKFNKYFLYYIAALFLFGIFYLYNKHNVGNDTSISEYLINYQGGFTRRGLPGEILFRISDYFNLSLRFSIFIFQSIIYLSFLILIFNFFKDIKKNIIIVFAIFTPIFLLFPVAEIESLGRKESVLFVFFLILININNPKNANLYLFFILPLVTLIWEESSLFSGFMFAVLIIKNKITNFIGASKIFLLFLPTILLNIIFLLYPLSFENHKIMADALMLKFNEICYMSCLLLVTNTEIVLYNNSNSSGGTLNYIWSTIDVKSRLIMFFRYTIILLIGFFPIFLLSFNSTFKSYNFFKKLFLNNILLLIFFLSLPIIPLFLYGGDWGRWVCITITFTTLFYFFLYKNNLIVVDYKNISRKLFFLKNKRKIVTILFILFAFTWNQKTTLREDVATMPFYKIPYNAIKITFGINNIRFFQDSFLIKFHQKYIE